MSALRSGTRGTDRFSSRVVAVVRLLVLFGLTAVLAPLQIISVILRLPTARMIPHLWHRAAVRVLGWRVVVRGHPSPEKRTFFVANHASYADILVLGSVAQVSYIAKAEVAKWPVFGTLARLHQTTFIERRGSRAAKQRDELSARLDAGHRLVLFAEGTSNDGIHVKPFKSALFSVVQDRDQDKSVTLQPVSIAYTRLDGIPVTRKFLSNFAWYGDMTLVPHLLDLLGLGAVTVEVTFHDAVDLSDFPSRKELAVFCHEVVSGGVAASRSGRAVAALPAPEGANS